jgi:hypothetical protein
MFDTFRKPGSFRIDYLNNAARGSPQAFAFYVRGELEDDAPYSITAKHHLCAGLNIIRKNLNCDHLVGIYVDINQAVNLFRPAYVQMKRDLRAKFFRQVFTFHSGDLIGDRAALTDLKELYRDVDGFDVISYRNGTLERASIFENGLSGKE